MERQVFLFDVDGHKALGFDTGLDSRAFARAKFAQFITEPGLIVNLEGANSSVNFWKASGVVEYSSMVVWGPSFKGDRLDLLLNDNDKREEALAAIRLWIRAVLALGEKHHAPVGAPPVGAPPVGAPPVGAPPVGAPPLCPCAALIGENQSSEIFFAPQSLVLHCLMAKESNRINNRYVQPDLNGMNAAAFTAAAMLYQVFTGSPAFPASDEIILHEDMREGNFLPIRLAVPGLDDKLAALIQNALNQNVKKGGLPNGARLLEGFLEILRTDPTDPTDPLSLFVSPLSEADKLSIEKEKNQYLKTNNVSVKTKRFVKRNAAVLLGSFVAVVITVLIVNSVIKSRSALSTAGMEPVQVIESYYNSFGKLDHSWMEACVVNGAGKDDINMVMNLFIISKLRQAYEYNVRPSFISAKEWLEMGGGQVDLQVFGVTDLQVTGNRGQLAMSNEQLASANKVGESNEERYRVDYTLWVPGEAENDPATVQDAMTDKRVVEYLPPISFRRTDFVTLVQKKKNWRISEISRVSSD
jgi:hypothetical protein